MSNLRIESVSSLSQDEVQVKTEPEDPGYDEAYSQSPVSTVSTVSADTNGHATPQNPPSNQNIRSILTNMLDQNKELSVKSVIDDLLQRNNTLLEQVDASIYKPQPRNTSNKKYDDIIRNKYGEHISRSSERSNILRPGSPTKACTIPKRDLPQMTSSVIVLNALEASSGENNIPHEYVCGVSSKAYVMTNEGVNMQSDLQFYWCNFCTFKTESKEVLVQHVIEHRFHCKYCSYQSFSRADVIRHSNEDHDEFKDVARSLKFCTFNSDYNEAENYKKRKLEAEAKKLPPAKKFKSAAQKEKEKAEKKKKSENTKKNSSKIDDEYDAFDMEVDEVEEEEHQGEEEESSPDKILIPRQTGTVKPVAQPVEQSLPTVTYNPPGASKTTEQGKQTAGNVTSTSTTKSGSTVTVSSGLCWNCGYCDFVTLSQTFLKTHLNTRHTGKAHKYVAMLVSSQDEMNKIKERDAMVYSTPSTVTPGGPNRAPALTTPTTTPPAPKENKEQKTASPKPDNISQAEESDDEEYIPEEEKKKYPLTYKCAHCNFNAPVCFKIKEHLLMKHLGCVLYALDMRAIKLKQRRYVFFCHRKNCSFTTKKTDEYLSHSDSCTPWLVENCPEEVDPQTRKCLEMTRSFSSKISQKAFQMAKNFKSNKVAEYACLYCSYSTNNNTRLKKHVLSNHREFATVMKDIHAHSMGKKTMVYFCKHCLWESRQEGELLEHLQSKHDDFTYVTSSSGASNSQNRSQQPRKPFQKSVVEPTSNTEVRIRQTESPVWESGNSDNVEENEEEEEEIQPEDLEVSEEEVQRMMDEYVKDEASHGRSPGRPMRKASAEASVRVRAQGHQPPMYRCMHCYHMCFGVNLMRKHIFTRHPKEPLRAIDVKKMMGRQFAYYCFCPKALCKTVNSSEQALINHAMQEHGLSDENDHLKALLLPFSPHTSTPAPPPTVVKTEEPENIEYEQPNNSIGYECLFCSTATCDTVQGMKMHVKEYHPSEEIIFRDCAARKLKKSSRIFMCEVDSCDIFYVEQKEFELHKLAHQNAHIYECTVCQWFTATPDSISDHMLALHKGGAATIEIQLLLDSDGQVIKRVSGTKIKQEPVDL